MANERALGIPVRKRIGGEGSSGQCDPAKVMRFLEEKKQGIHDALQPNNLELILKHD